MIFFKRKLAFQPVDPLGDGLGDEIAHEQRESEAILLEEQLDDQLASKWDEILNDVHQDPDWFDFANDE